MIFQVDNQLVSMTELHSTIISGDHVKTNPGPIPISLRV